MFVRPCPVLVPSTFARPCPGTRHIDICSSLAFVRPTSSRLRPQFGTRSSAFGCPCLFSLRRPLVEALARLRLLRLQHPLVEVFVCIVPSLRIGDVATRRPRLPARPAITRPRPSSRRRLHGLVPALITSTSARPRHSSVQLLAVSILSSALARRRSRAPAYSFYGIRSSKRSPDSVSSVFAV